MGSERFALIKETNLSAVALAVAWVQSGGRKTMFVEELNELIAKYLGPKATFGDYMTLEGA